jgi:hypothetical protein
MDKEELLDFYEKNKGSRLTLYDYLDVHLSLEDLIELIKIKIKEEQNKCS